MQNVFLGRLALYHTATKLVGKNRGPTTKVYKVVILPLILQEHPRVKYKNDE